MPIFSAYLHTWDHVPISIISTTLLTCAPKPQQLITVNTTTFHPTTQQQHLIDFFSQGNAIPELRIVLIRRWRIGSVCTYRMALIIKHGEGLIYLCNAMCTHTNGNVEEASARRDGERKQLLVIVAESPVSLLVEVGAAGELIEWRLRADIRSTAISAICFEKLIHFCRLTSTGL